MNRRSFLKAVLGAAVLRVLPLSISAQKTLDEVFSEVFMVTLPSIKLMIFDKNPLYEQLRKCGQIVFVGDNSDV